MTTPKTNPGNFFEDFRLGQDILHAIPRTVSEGDVALYIGLTGSRFALHSSDSFAQSLGLPSAPIDDMLAFHLIFGRELIRRITHTRIPSPVCIDNLSI